MALDRADTSRLIISNVFSVLEQFSRMIESFTISIEHSVALLSQVTCDGQPKPNLRDATSLSQFKMFSKSRWYG